MQDTNEATTIPAKTLVKIAHSKDGNTMLHMAAMYNLKKLCKALIECGTSAIVQNDAGRTPAEEAEHWGHKELAAFIIQQTCQRDGDTQSLNLLSEGAHCLCEAIEAGDTDTAIGCLNPKYQDTLCENVNYQRGSDNATALHLAAARGSYAIALALLKRDAKKDLKDCCERTAEDVANEWGHERVAKLIATYPNHDICPGCVSLTISVQKKHITCAKKRLRAGENPNATCPFGISYLHQAIKRLNPPMVGLLLREGADVLTVDTLHHETPLQLAYRLSGNQSLFRDVDDPLGQIIVMLWIKRFMATPRIIKAGVKKYAYQATQHCSAWAQQTKIYQMTLTAWELGSLLCALALNKPLIDINTIDLD